MTASSSQSPPAPQRPSAPQGPPTLSSLLKDIVDGLGTLVAGHVKLARVELEATAKLEGRRVGLVALAGALALMGYALACVAAALALARVTGAPLAFLAVGGVHLLGAGAALAAQLRRTSTRPLGETMTELDTTVTALSADARAARHALEGAAPPTSPRNGARTHGHVA
jgi:uncharacterized membrane protein YqjE